MGIFIPLGKGVFRTVATFVCFYLIASPFTAAVALTDWFTTSVATKMVACVGATSIAQFSLAVWFLCYLSKMDWQEAGAIINRRANNDKEEERLQQQQQQLPTLDGGLAE